MTKLLRKCYDIYGGEVGGVLPVLLFGFAILALFCIEFLYTNLFRHLDLSLDAIIGPVFVKYVTCFSYIILCFPDAPNANYPHLCVYISRKSI